MLRLGTWRYSGLSPAAPNGPPAGSDFPVSISATPLFVKLAGDPNNPARFKDDATADALRNNVALVHPAELLRRRYDDHFHCDIHFGPELSIARVQRHVATGSEARPVRLMKG
jgi:hypothetical protein